MRQGWVPTPPLPCRYSAIRPIQPNYPCPFRRQEEPEPMLTRRTFLKLSAGAGALAVLPGAQPLRMPLFAPICR
ncbi:MAG: twin-arginine translocation signal domain-containing protein, partial [Caldilineaceae bacterium]|nr:twin-arginine translocation signal domain-containing protein [Caldilineaceae bacterium]